MKNQQEIATPKSLSANANDANSISQKNKQSPTKKITYLATFTALSTALKVFGNYISFIPTIKFNLHILVWYMSTVVMDPFKGGLVAGISDILGQLVFPQPGSTGFNPLITIGNICNALSFGLVFKYTPIKNEPIKAILAGIVSACVGTLGINTLATFLMQTPDKAMPYIPFLISRLPQLLISTTNVVLFCLLIPLCKRLKKNLE